MCPHGHPVPPAGPGSPVGQAQDEELEEGGFQQQILVLPRQLGEALDFLGPFADDVHGAREEVVELLHIHRILLLQVAWNGVLELGGMGVSRRWGWGWGGVGWGWEAAQR